MNGNYQSEMLIHEHKGRHQAAGGDDLGRAKFPWSTDWSSEAFNVRPLESLARDPLGTGWGAQSSLVQSWESRKSAHSCPSLGHLCSQTSSATKLVCLCSRCLDNYWPHCDKLIHFSLSPHLDMHRGSTWELERKQEGKRHQGCKRRNNLWSPWSLLLFLRLDIQGSWVQFRRQSTGQGLRKNVRKEGT